MTYERKIETTEHMMPDGRSYFHETDSDLLAEYNADVAAIDGQWEQWAHPGFEESARQIAEIAKRDWLHEQALIDDEERTYYLEESRLSSEGVMHGPFYQQGFRDFYALHNGVWAAINRALSSGDISPERADVLRINVEPWLLEAYDREMDFEALHEEALIDDEYREMDAEQERLSKQEEDELWDLEYTEGIVGDEGEEEFLDDTDADLEARCGVSNHDSIVAAMEQDEGDASPPGYDYYDREDDEICPGICGQPENCCTCEETISWRNHNPDDGYWTA